MKIVLVIERSKEKSAHEETFRIPHIRFGRDEKQSEVAFDNRDFRMVSRNHAELRLEGGKWVLRDLGSSYGTYVNGEKISSPRVVAVGNSIQFGLNGPKAHIIWIETDAESRAAEGPAAGLPAGGVTTHKDSARQAVPSPVPGGVSEPEPPARPGSIRPKEPEARAPAKPAPPQRILKPFLKFVDAPAKQPIAIAKDSVWMGRDPNADVVIEASAVMVSRRHAEIRRQNGGFVLSDNKSFNGTLVNGQRISAPTPLYHEDTIQLGLGGPVLRFDSPELSDPSAKAPAGQRSVNLSQMPGAAGGVGDKHAGTLVIRMGDISQRLSKSESEHEQLLMQLAFGEKSEIGIGRNEANEIRLDGLQISNRHARLRRTPQGILIEDLNSTNGVYLNGKRVSRQPVGPEDAVQIGAFVIRIDEFENIGVFDTRSKTRIDSVGITKYVKDRAGGGTIKLLDDISLSVRPNEFIGLLGTSGAGKSTLMDALSGMRPASEGNVYVNNLDLYRYLDSLKQSIGYVPQDDIIHRQLSVYRTLYYVAKLRLSGDVSASEINQIIDEVLDVTGLAERRDVAVSRLSGGQRKRVSMAVELITKPSVIFLDEPTSGLDPSTEEKIMRLFRQIAESGRTVILTTHAMENVGLFDKVVLLMRGKLVFYGTPSEALAFAGAKNFKDLFDKLEEPVESQVSDRGEASRAAVTETVAEIWKRKFLETPQFRSYVQEPLKEIDRAGSEKFKKSRSLGLFGALRQWFTLSGRYARVLAKDKFTLAILFAQAPIIALLVYFVMGATQPRDFAYFALALCAMWFGTSVAAREIVRERRIYERERMVNLGILPYIASKLLVLGIIVSIQCLLLFIPLEFLNLTGLMPMPGMFLGIPQFFTMILTAGVGIATGLLISTIVRTSEMATSLVPLILIPQIIFSGLIGVPDGINRMVGLTMPAAWSFDTMKRFSTLDTLEREGAIINGATEGLGLFKYIEKENEKVVEGAKKNIKDYEGELEARLREAEKRANTGETVRFSGLPDRPAVSEAKKIPEDLSNYITFLHPWMHPVLNQFVLIFMFVMLFLWTIVILRLKDVG